MTTIQTAHLFTVFPHLLLRKSQDCQKSQDVKNTTAFKKIHQVVSDSACRPDMSEALDHGDGLSE